MVCLTCVRRLGVPLQVPPGAQGACRVASGKSSLHSSCEAQRRSALDSRQGNQASIRMERGISRGFLSYCRKCGFPRVATAPEGASHVVSGKSGILSSCEGPLRIPLELVQVTKASSRVEAGNSALTGISGSLWRFPWGVRRRLVLEHGTLLPSRGEKGVSSLLSS